jgi:hypothetical protein
VKLDGEYVALPADVFRWVRPEWPWAPERLNLNPQDVYTHLETDLGSLRYRYSCLGWNTNVVFQDINHDGPTAARRSGFPAMYPEDEFDLSRWGDDVVLRLHVDVCWYRGGLVSSPHVEPDPRSNWQEHLAMYENHDEIRGPLAVRIFRRFFF